MVEIFKYPRTNHLQGSRFQFGDDALRDVPYSELTGKYLVVEEKMDGANSGISFSDDGRLLLQSRGHYLTGGPREKHFDLLKTWANRHASALWDLLGSQYVMYGEWMYAKHTVFYDELPHYFMEFDFFDKENKLFLSTKKRMDMLKSHPYIISVKVLLEGVEHSKEIVDGLVGPSYFIKEGHSTKLAELSSQQNLRVEQVLHETDPSILMEGLYIKLEEEGIVKERYKFVRSSFLSTVMNAEGHWLNRPIIPNQLREGVNIF